MKFCKPPYSNMEKYTSLIKEHLDIFVIRHEAEDDGQQTVEKSYTHEVLIHGDPQGLRSLAALLMAIADLDQDTVTDLPDGSREHVHLYNRYVLSRSSDPVIIGRLDAKGTGAFYDRYVAREVLPKRKARKD